MRVSNVVKSVWGGALMSKTRVDGTTALCWRRGQAGYLVWRGLMGAAGHLHASHGPGELQSDATVEP